MKRISWKDIAKRITGISTAVIGVSWNQGPDERKIAEEIVTYIENKGLFYAPFEWEHPEECFTAAATARDGLTELMQRLNRDMKVFEHAESIRDSLRNFQRALKKLSLDTKHSKSDMSNDQITAFDKELVQLRTLCGAHLAWIAATYQLDVHSELDHWLRDLPGDKS